MLSLIIFQSALNNSSIVTKDHEKKEGVWEFFILI
jgi:hypothetical protein